jgi:hypothetical protein
MGVPAHWTGSSHLTQAAIIERNGGNSKVVGRFHYASNANEQMYAVTGSSINQNTTFARGAFLRTSGTPIVQIKPPPQSFGQKKIHYEVASSVLWNLKLMGWSQYLLWLSSSSPPRGSFWGRNDGMSNYPALAAAQNSYKLKAFAGPKTVGFIGNFQNYAFSADGTVTDYLLWAFLGGGSDENIIQICPSFSSSVYFEYFTTRFRTEAERQASLEKWPTKHVSFSWRDDT